MSLEHDPIESTPKYLAVCEAIEEAAWAAVAAAGIEPHAFGSCHAFWAHKKRLLWKHHRLRWRTPSDLNPHVMFD
jgi:hypothetical protein